MLEDWWQSIRSLFEFSVQFWLMVKAFKLSPVTNNSKCDIFIEFKNNFWECMEVTPEYFSEQSERCRGLTRRGRGPSKKEFLLRRRLPSSMNTLWIHQKVLRRPFGVSSTFFKTSKGGANKICRNSPPELFIGKRVLKNMQQIYREHPYPSVILKSYFATELATSEFGPNS